ncbi:MAG: hypothetical protein ACMXYF_01335 [Candidatus Woesearchaeota archaeon]
MTSICSAVYRLQLTGFSRRSYPSWEVESTKEPKGQIWYLHAQADTFYGPLFPKNGEEIAPLTFSRFTDSRLMNAYLDAIADGALQARRLTGREAISQVQKLARYARFPPRTDDDVYVFRTDM